MNDDKPVKILRIETSKQLYLLKDSILDNLIRLRTNFETGVTMSVEKFLDSPDISETRKDNYLALESLFDQL